ncbi:MAG: class II aldolase/adducin family protein [Desulfovibrio sp.]|nr:class II aldolase/adducin family protein [Desulfovibrio sp.]
MNGFWDEEGAASGPPGSEDELLGLIDAEFPSLCPHLPFGRGHDCAELAGIAASPENVCLALSTDLFLQDVHFSTRYFLPEEAGAKALSSAVSDLAAAGAAPLGFSLGLMLPPRISVKTVARMLSGMARKAREYGLWLSGGDLSRSNRVGFSVTLWGTPCGSVQGFLRRSAARRETGDVIFLVGQAGLARVGLWALEKYGRAALGRFPSACLAHLDPRPLLREGRILAALSGQSGESLALMDLSDGLLRDLPRLLQGLGASLDFSPALFHEEVLSASVPMREPAAEIVLRGGEDYALLGVCKPDLWSRVEECLPEAVLLGEVSPEKGICLSGVTFAKDGFDHFSPAAAVEKPGHWPPRRVRAGKKPLLWTGMARPGEKRLTRVRVGLPRRLLPPETGAAARAIITTGLRAGFSGFTSGFNSNISVRVTLADGSAACLITRAGVDKSALSYEDLVLLSLSGEKICGAAEASTESSMHLEIYRAAPGSRAVLHSHPPCLLALSLSPLWDRGFALPLPEVERYRALLAVTPFFPPGTAELAAAVGKAAGEHAALWLTRHGLVTHGPDLAFALSLTAELEQTAKIALMTFRLVPQTH